MSRIFKFRAWDKHEKKMLNNPKLFEIIKVYDNQGDLLYRIGRNTYVDAEYVQQFTGSLDINGKEIYEGDIVQGIVPNGETVNYKGAVEWLEKQTAFIPFCMCSLRQCEVIGNIYENPDLLK